MARVLDFFIRELKDQYLETNFRRLNEYLFNQVILRGEFKFFELTFPAAVTNQRVKHFFNFVPKDIIQTSLTGGSTLTWNYDEFDREFLNVTTSGPATVRAFIGRYKEGAL